MARVLIVEDDRPLAQVIADWLSGENHAVEVAFDGSAAITKLNASEYDVIIVDWQLPGFSGLDLLRAHRSKGGTTSALMLTARNSLSDKETGLDSGFDDYLTKPFEMRELSARVRALLRRATVADKQVLRCGSLELDAHAYRLLQNGIELRIQPLELSLLEFFLRNPNHIFSVDKLIQSVWGFAEDVTEDGVRSSIKRLRKVIGAEEADRIVNVHGVGYRFDSRERPTKQP